MMIHHAGETSNYEFCITPFGGLGNRLLALSAGIRFLEKNYYKRMRINWINTFEIGVNMKDILTIDHDVYEGPPFEDSPYLPLGHLPEIRVSTHDKLNISHFACFRSINDDPNEDLTPEWKKAIKRIKFTELLKSIADSIDVTDRIGIHCRRSDYWTGNHEDAARMYVKLDELFIQYLKINYPTSKFFLATDSPFTLINFEKEFGNRVLHYPKSSYPLWRTRDSNCVKEGVVDHILLSRCNKIIADSTSTFSQTAAWFNGADKEQWSIYSGKQ